MRNVQNSNAPSQSADDASDASSRPPRRKRDAFFSWLGSGFGSLTLHALVFLLVFLAVRAGSRIDGARGVRQTDEIGIVFSEELDDAGGGAESDAASERDEPNASEEPTDERSDLAEELASVAESFLPTEPDSTIGPTARPSSASSAASSMGSESDVGATSGTGTVDATNGAGQTVGFGDVRGKGRKFVYVLDRSDSMSWRGGAPMRRAVAETVASVESLDRKRGATKFQLVCFNHESEVFEDGRALLDVDLANKARVVRFLKSVSPSGGTAPEKALEVALKMRPDVVFFLTDADEELSEAALAEIAAARRRYKVKQICVVEFGRGTAPKKKTFRRLAGENGGAYIFKDVDSF